MNVATELSYGALKTVFASPEVSSWNIAEFDLGFREAKVANSVQMLRAHFWSEEQSHYSASIPIYFPVPFYPKVSGAVYTLDEYECSRATLNKFRSYMKRIEELRGYAIEDGFDLDIFSLINFSCFVILEPNIKRGSLVLIDNGNLFAEWQSCEGAKLGLEFLGDGMIQYVIFKNRKSALESSRIYGRDTFEEVRHQIKAFNLGSLLYE